MDTTPFSPAAGGLPVSGVIGTVFLYQVTATIDYPGGRLLLETRDGGCAAETFGTVAARVPFHLADDHLILARGGSTTRGT